MRRNNKKGFTIVELVIVIAVIAILAGVLIPTFAGVVGNAKESAALQEAKNMYSEYIATFNYSSGNEPEEKVIVTVDGITVVVEDGEASIPAETPDATAIPTLTKNEDGTYTAATYTANEGEAG